MKYFLTIEELKKANSASGQRTPELARLLVESQPMLLRWHKSEMTQLENHGIEQGNDLAMALLLAFKFKYGLTAPVSESEYRSALLQAVDLLHDPLKRQQHPQSKLVEALTQLTRLTGTPHEIAANRECARHSIAALLALTRKFEEAGVLPEIEVEKCDSPSEMLFVGSQVMVTIKMSWRYDFDGGIALRMPDALAAALLENVRKNVGCHVFEKLNIVNLEMDAGSSTVTGLMECYYWPVFPVRAPYRPDMKMEELAELFDRCRGGWANAKELRIKGAQDSEEAWRTFQTTDWQVVGIEKLVKPNTTTLLSLDLQPEDVQRMRMKEHLWDWHAGADRLETASQALHPDMMTWDECPGSKGETSAGVDNLRFRVFELRQAQPALAAYLEIPEPRSAKWEGAQLWDYAAFLWNNFRTVYGDIPAATPETVEAAVRRAAELVADTQQFLGYSQIEVAASTHFLANLMGPGVDFPNTEEGRPLWAKLLTVIEVMEAQRTGSMLLKAA